jgi:hypothetical protein
LTCFTKTPEGRELLRKLSVTSDRRSGGERKARERQGGREILRLRGPTRHNSAHRKKSGRSAQDDNKEERRDNGGMTARRRGKSKTG